MNSGLDYTIRIPTENDAQAIIDFAKKMFGSTDQVLTTPAEYLITLEQEQEWIRHGNNHPDTLILIAEMDGMVIGLLDFAPKTRLKNNHTGEFGVSVHADFRKKGIGRALIFHLLNWAQTNSTIEKVILQVFASNTHAIKLYTDLGFVEEGRFPKAIKQPDGDYIELIQMYMFV
jgi:RimJ/RimL family protein N-acetyltransferase